MSDFVVGGNNDMGDARSRSDLTRRGALLDRLDRLGNLRLLGLRGYRMVANIEQQQAIAALDGPVLYPGTEICFRQIREQRCKELQSEHPDSLDPQPDSEEVIFCHPNGQPIQNFKNSFSALLKFAGIPVKRDGKRRSIYSFRHYYATRQLSKEVNPFLLAKQMGTSVEMLEKHYGQVMTR